MIFQLALLAHAAVRIAAVANDEGLVTDLPLRFAEADARAVLSALDELHPDSDRRPELLIDATPASVRSLLERWRTTAAAEDSLIFFLSGHGDRRGAHLGGEILPWPELDRALQNIPARVAVVIIDACQSGALLGPKGFVRGPPATISIEERGPRGRVYLTSSGANEVSHESVLFGGSPFTQHLVSGLRGAADSDDDGAITLSEIYRHLYSRTFADTVESPLGPQRPQQAIKLSGSGDLVLAKNAGAKLFGAKDRVCYVLDAGEERLLGELRGPKPIRLKPGNYAVKCPLPDAQVAYSTLQLVDEASIEKLVFTTRTAELSLAKGSSAPRDLRLNLGGLLSSNAAGELSGGAAFGLSSLRDDVALEMQVVLQSDRDNTGGALLAGAGYVLPWWRLGTLEIGIETGAGFGPEGGSFFLGQLTRVAVPIGQNTRGFLRFDALTEVTLARDAPLTLRFLLSLGVSLPIGEPSGIERSERME